MDYYNDFQRIIRSDDIAKVIDRHLLRLRHLSSPNSSVH